MTSSKRPPKSESQNQDSNTGKSDKKTAPNQQNDTASAPPSSSPESKKTPAGKSESKASGDAGAKPSVTDSQKNEPPAVREERPPVDPSHAKPPLGRRARLAGIVVLGFVAGILGGGGASYVLLQNRAALGLETAAPEDKRLASIQQWLEGMSVDVVALQQKSDRLEGALERLRAEDSQQNAPDAAAVKELSDRVKGLEQAVANTLSGGTEGTPLEGAEVAALNNALADLRQDVTALNGQVNARLAALEQNAPPANLDQILSGLAPRSAVRDLETRLTTLEADSSGSDAKRAALGLALAGLIRAADRGEPFLVELETMALLAPDRTEWQGLQPYAAQGLRQSGALTRDFDEMARGVLRAEQMQRADTWWRRLWANIRALVTIRRTGDLKGQSAQAIIARAEQRLKEGRLRAAAQELHGLQGAAAASVAPWLDELEGRLKLDDLVSSVSAGLLSELGSQDEAL